MSYLKTAGNFVGKVMEPKKTASGRLAWIQTNPNGKSYLSLCLEIADGPCKGQWVEKELYVTPDAEANSMRQLAEAFGWQGDNRMLIGQLCRFEVTMKTGNNGKDYATVGWINHVNSTGGRKTVDEDRVVTASEEFQFLAKLGAMAKNHNAKMAAQAQATATVNRAVPAPSLPAVQPQAGGDDVPF
jgi:hypothetical protein